MAEPPDQVTEFHWTSRSPDDTDRFAATLAPFLPDRTVLALIGTLGAGKTRFVQGLAAACGIPREDVVSPTFVLCQTYHGDRTIQHYDLYRLTREQEFWNLGPEEAWESGLVVIEWADRFPQCLPPDRLELEFTVVSDTVREFALRARGKRHQPLLAALAAALGP